MDQTDAKFHLITGLNKPQAGTMCERYSRAALRTH